jgi:ATP-dependent RNA helicase DeaD
LNISRKSERRRTTDRGRNNKKDKKGGRTGHAEQGYSRFFINLGKLQNLEAHNLIGLINEYTRQRNIPIGKIDILRKFSFFEVDSNHEKDVLEGLANANWNGNKVSVELSKPPSYGGNFRKSAKENGRKRFDSKRKSSSNRRKSGGRRSGGVEGSFKDKFKASTKRKKR